MRIAFITSGAAGMFCGSCMRDNTLVAALRRLGHDALLIPTYTPIRTDEADVSESRVFFGGINVYLEQKTWLFRHTPWLFDRLLNFNRLLRWVSRFAVRTPYSVLGALTVSMLRGSHGKQRKEVARLTSWLANEMRPEAVILSNALLSGALPELKGALAVPIFITLQGDDIFLEALPAADRAICLDLIRGNDAAVTGYICTSRYYADFMAGYLGIDRAKMHVIHPGLNLAGHSERPERNEPIPAIGYFARICPEKGFHNLVDAFLRLRQDSAAPPCRLLASGWLGDNNRPYLEAQRRKLAAAGLAGEFTHVECPTHDDKVRFLHSIDVLSVPTMYHEPKGLYVLEAWANGIPVVQPRHGSFPELIEAAEGGLLVPPNDAHALADALRQMLVDGELRARLGRSGAAAVRDRFSAEAMAKQTAALLERFANPAN
ncbi:MAG TPA: glycosyltransferase family 4 protein [Gemmataceae bacterium]|jgi:glycosyltransferase involved in cell wall biosynthesis